MWQLIVLFLLGLILGAHPRVHPYLSKASEGFLWLVSFLWRWFWGLFPMAWKAVFGEKTPKKALFGGQPQEVGEAPAFRPPFKDQPPGEGTT